MVSKFRHVIILALRETSVFAHMVVGVDCLFPNTIHNKNIFIYLATY